MVSVSAVECQPGLSPGRNHLQPHDTSKEGLESHFTNGQAETQRDEVFVYGHTVSGRFITCFQFSWTTKAWVLMEIFAALMWHRTRVHMASQYSSLFPPRQANDLWAGQHPFERSFWISHTKRTSKSAQFLGFPIALAWTLIECTSSHLLVSWNVKDSSAQAMLFWEGSMHCCPA